MANMIGLTDQVIVIFIGIVVVNKAKVLSLLCKAIDRHDIGNLWISFIDIKIVGFTNERNCFLN